MSEATEVWKERFMTLTPSERAELLGFLLASLATKEAGEEIAQAWFEESERRIEEIRSGKAVGIPMDESLADLRRRYPDPINDPNQSQRVKPARNSGGPIPVEELLYHREHLGDLLREGAVRHVLIVGREVISFFDDLESAAKYAAEHHGKHAVLIKKVAAIEPVHTLGGALLDSSAG